MILRRTVIRCLCIIFALLIFWVCHATAVSTTIWEQISYDDFSAGKPDKVSIASINQVTLARALTSVDGGISELRVWCLEGDSQGNIYAGTGDNGKLFKVAKDGSVSLLFDSPETDIISLAVDGNDNVYAGTSPDGIIYRIKPGSVPETFFNTGEKYVWSLAFDKTGNIYAGTGIAGKIYRVAPDGKGDVVYDSNETHIKSLLSSGDSIYAGSEENGIIYKISSEGKTFVLYDTPAREISCLAVDAKGNLYAGAASGETSPRQPSEQGPPAPSGNRGKEERKSVIYQITSDEVVKEIWEAPDPLIFSIIPDGEKLIVGTGNEGMIYSVTPEGDCASVADSEESQVLSFYRTKDNDEIWLATGNPGKIYKISSAYEKEGTLESQKCDASITSRWGKISWDAVTAEETGLTLSTRSGNTEKPDDTWSGWSEEYTDAFGSTITSPPARFIQWRAKLTSADGTTAPVLKSVSVAYLQRNLKPVIDLVTIASEQEKPESPQRRPPAKGQNSGKEAGSIKKPLNGKNVIKWQASDPNGDTLEYSVYFRGADEKNWKLLEEELKDTSYPIDTESFPDGTYFIRVVAVDLPSNPTDLALSYEEISDPFDIDNTPPKVSKLESKPVGEGRFVVIGEVEDVTSYINNIVYSIDGKDWRPLFPLDHIFDAKIENFSLPTESLEKGEHTIVIKATDIAGNTGAAKIVVTAE